ncbi:MAG: hypothetical protein Fur0032_21320 [Terrimicrobiaceae bacterium]
MAMPAIAIVVGALLDVVGFTAFLMSGMKSYTALIPSGIGTIILLLGFMSLVKPAFRKHFMHGAATLGLLGLLGSMRGVVQLPALMSGAEGVKPVAVIGQAATAVICLVFLILCIKSFIDARKKAAAPVD